MVKLNTDCADNILRTKILLLYNKPYACQIVGQSKSSSHSSNLAGSTARSAQAVERRPAILLLGGSDRRPLLSLTFTLKVWKEHNGYLVKGFFTPFPKTMLFSEDSEFLPHATIYIYIRAHNHVSSTPNGPKDRR